jgi:hypothetical protein
LQPGPANSKMHIMQQANGGHMSRLDGIIVRI